jgi:hypothetical protein
MPDPHRPPREDGLKTYQTEKGWTCRAESGRLAVTVEGLADEEEAVDAATGALGRLAKRRGVEPARVIDRTPRRLLDALRVP